MRWYALGIGTVIGACSGFGLADAGAGWYASANVGLVVAWAWYKFLRECER